MLLLFFLVFANTGTGIGGGGGGGGGGGSGGCGDCGDDGSSADALGKSAEVKSDWVWITDIKGFWTDKVRDGAEK